MTVAAGIKAEEASIDKIFSDDFLFEVPIFQRPFIWNSENFEELFDDISTAKDSDEEQYFLGSILLQETAPKKYQVVDGQQRLTALTILFASIRDNANHPNVRTTAQDLIYQKANELRDIQEQMRIIPWADLETTFKTYIYAEGGTNRFLTEFEERAIPYKDEDDPKYHIYEALKTFKAKLSQTESIDKLIKYILTKTFIVYIKTSTQTSAFRLFNVLNSRGESLNTSDLLKSENLGEIKNTRLRETCADTWHDIEETLGREELENVINFIRTIKIQEKAKVNIYDEYQKVIFKNKLLPKGEDFFSYVNDIAGIYEVKILNATNNSTKAETRNKYFALATLMDNFLPFSDWKPPLIHFYHTYKKEDLMLDMLLKLEQKSFVEWAAGFSFVERFTSLTRILKLIDNCRNAQAVIEKMLDPEDSETKRGKVARSIDYSNHSEIISNLRVFDDPQFYSKYGGKLAKYTLLRLDIERTDLDTVKNEYSGSITVEHILPRNPVKDSEWTHLFNEQQRIEWTNKLGNLVLLSGKKNSQAQNFEFDKKKSVYFFAQNKKTNFIITQDLKDIKIWNYEEAVKRHDSFKNALFGIYAK